VRRPGPRGDQDAETEDEGAAGQAEHPPTGLVGEEPDARGREHQGAAEVGEDGGTDGAAVAQPGAEAGQQPEQCQGGGQPVKRQPIGERRHATALLAALRCAGILPLKRFWNASAKRR
jgi:hypothetical protein